MYDADWLTEGAKVVLITNNCGAESVAVTTVDRFTKTQVVCANGDRVNRDKLIHRTSGYGPSTTLVAYDSDEGRRAVARSRRRNALRAVRKASDAVESRDTAKGGDDALMAALADLMDVADRARTVIDETR